MFFDERDSESAQSEVAQIGQFSPGLPATLSERVAVEYRAQVRDRNMNSLLDNRAALLDEQVGRAKELGYNLKRPKVPGEGGVNTPEAISAYNAMVDKIEAETGVGLIRLNQPVIGRGYPGEGSPDRNVSGGGAWEPLDRELQKRAIPERAEEADIRARTPGFGGFVASIAGGAAGSFKDPVVALTTPLGAPGGAGFWKTVLAEAAINMALEVPTQGLLIQEARERGIEVTFGTAAVDVLTAGVAGAGFSAAAEGLSRGLIKAFEKVGDVKVKKIVKKLEAGEDLSLAEKATMAAEIDRQVGRMTAQEVSSLVDEVSDARPLTSSEQFARDAVDIDAEVQRSPFGDDLEADIRHRANLERTLEDIVNEEPEIRLDNDGVVPTSADDAATVSSQYGKLDVNEESLVSFADRHGFENSDAGRNLAYVAAKNINELQRAPTARSLVTKRGGSSTAGPKSLPVGFDMHPLVGDVRVVYDSMDRAVSEIYSPSGAIAAPASGPVDARGASDIGVTLPDGTRSAPAILVEKGKLEKAQSISTGSGSVTLDRPIKGRTFTTAHELAHRLSDRLEALGDKRIKELGLAAADYDRSVDWSSRPHEHFADSAALRMSDKKQWKRLFGDSDDPIHRFVGDIFDNSERYVGAATDMPTPRIDPDFEQVKTPPVMDRNFVEADQTPVAAATRELDYLLDEKTPDAEVKLVADERLAQLGNEVIGVDEATGKNITAKSLLEEFDREEKLLEAMRFCKIR